jgi:hypothetical protein
VADERDSSILSVFLESGVVVGMDDMNVGDGVMDVDPRLYVLSCLYFFGFVCAYGNAFT